MITSRRVLSHTILYGRNKGCHGFESRLSGKDRGGKWEEWDRYVGGRIVVCIRGRNIYFMFHKHVVEPKHKSPLSTSHTHITSRTTTTSNY